MDKELGQWLTYALLFGTGGLTLVIGVLSQFGIWKIWFVTKRVPVLVVPSLIFGAIPGGLALIVAGMVFAVPRDLGSVLLCALVLPLLATCFTLAIFEPTWLKPAWYRWLEANHASIIPLLKKEARAMGRWKWQRRVATQEGLEQWVAEVRQKRGLS